MNPITVKEIVKATGGTLLMGKPGDVSQVLNMIPENVEQMICLLQLSERIRTHISILVRCWKMGAGQCWCHGKANG